MQPDQMRTPAEAAKAYMSLGWSPIRVHGLRAEGSGCTCSKGADCRSAAKHPTDNEWQAQGLETAEEIDAAFAGWRAASSNVGIRTGLPSGCFVLDVDDLESLRALVRDHRDLPRTRVHRTGSGGLHFFFAMPDSFSPTNRRGGLKEYPGLDVRGDGGQVVMPPSRSAKGSYTVETNAPIIEAPGWLLDLLRPKAAKAPVTAAAAVPLEGITDQEQLRLEAYSARACAAEVARLVAMREAATPDGTGYRGEAWNDGVFQVACSLIELANSPWTAYRIDDARSDVLTQAPRDVGFGPAEIEKCWQSACNKIGDNARPVPAARPSTSDEVPSWATDVGVRVDPSLLKGQEPPSKVAELFTDAHLTERIARDVMDGRFCWAAALGWMAWDGRRWASTDDAAVSEAVRLYLIDWHSSEARGGADSTRLKALSGLMSRARIVALVGLARGKVRVDSEAFDRHPDLLNVGNGVVDLTTGTLRPHDPALLLTRVTRVDYRPGAQHPDVQQALEALPPECRPYLQVRLGQGVTGHMSPDDTLTVTQGDGSNGKSTLLDLVSSALGEHAVVVPERALLANPNDHPTELMTLRGARLAVIEELPEGGRLAVNRLKAVVGTPRMTARHIRKDNVSWDASHTLVLATNYRPTVNESDHGTWRRLELVRFPYTFVAPGAAAMGPTCRAGDPTLRQRLHEGREGQHEAALAWLVEGARRWYAADRVMPAPPAVVVADTVAWRAEADRIHAYVSERLVLDGGAHVVATELFADFSEWLASHGFSAWSDATFASRFGAHELISGKGVDKRRVRAGAATSRRPHCLPGALPSQYTAWVGLRYRKDDEDPVQGVQGCSVTPHEGNALALTEDPYTPCTQAAWEPFLEAAS